MCEKKRIPVNENIKSQSKNTVTNTACKKDAPIGVLYNLFGDDYLTERERKLQQCIPSEHGLASGTKECTQPEVAKGTSNLTLTDDMKKAGVTWRNKANKKVDLSSLKLSATAYKTEDPSIYVTGKNNIDSIFAGRLAKLAKDYGTKVNIISGYRTNQEQQALVNSNGKKPGYYIKNNAAYNSKNKMMVAAPGNSRHNYKFAADCSGFIINLNNTVLNKYGLCKPMDYENWHIEPIETMNRIPVNENIKSQNKNAITNTVYKKDSPLGVDDLWRNKLEQCIPLEHSFASGAKECTHPKVGNQDVKFYVDRFEVAYYDPDYRFDRISRYSKTLTFFSKWLRVKYRDGTIIDINIDDISEERPDGPTMLEQMAHAHIGEGGRIFPEKMNAATTPRLAEAKRNAIKEMDKATAVVKKALVTEIISILVQVGTSTVVPLPKTTSRLASIRQRTAHPADKEINKVQTTITLKPLKSTGASTKGVSKAVSVNPNEIRFSQSSVNGPEEIIQSMKANGWKGDPIDVVRMSDGKLTTIDNTRVVAARKAGIEVQATIHDASELLPESLIDRFTTKKGVPTTWGEAIELRIGKQSPSFRNNNPFGADTMERIGK